MRYAESGAFRRALEDRLRTQSLRAGTPLVRLRKKDLVDIILMAEMRPMRAATLLEAFRATFEDRKTHALPNALPDPPSSWATPFRRLASEVGLESERMDAGLEV